MTSNLLADPYTQTVEPELRSELEEIHDQLSQTVPLDNTYTKHQFEKRSAFTRIRTQIADDHPVEVQLLVPAIARVVATEVERSFPDTSRRMFHRGFSEQVQAIGSRTLQEITGPQLAAMCERSGHPIEELFDSLSTLLGDTSTVDYQQAAVVVLSELTRGFGETVAGELNDEELLGAVGSILFETTDKRISRAGCKVLACVIAHSERDVQINNRIKQGLESTATIHDTSTQALIGYIVDETNIDISGEAAIPELAGGNILNASQLPDVGGGMSTFVEELLSVLPTLSKEPPVMYGIIKRIQQKEGSSEPQLLAVGYIAASLRGATDDPPGIKVLRTRIQQLAARNEKNTKRQHLRALGEIFVARVMYDGDGKLEDKLCKRICEYRDFFERWHTARALGELVAARDERTGDSLSVTPLREQIRNTSGISQRVYTNALGELVVAGYVMNCRDGTEALIYQVARASGNERLGIAKALGEVLAIQPDASPSSPAISTLRQLVRESPGNGDDRRATARALGEKVVHETESTETSVYETIINQSEQITKAYRSQLVNTLGEVFAAHPAGQPEPESMQTLRSLLDNVAERYTVAIPIGEVIVSLHQAQGEESVLSALLDNVRASSPNTKKYIKRVLGEIYATNTRFQQQTSGINLVSMRLLSLDGDDRFIEAVLLGELIAAHAVTAWECDDRGALNEWISQHSRSIRLLPPRALGELITLSGPAETDVAAIGHWVDRINTLQPPSRQREIQYLGELVHTHDQLSDPNSPELIKILVNDILDSDTRSKTPAIVLTEFTVYQPEHFPPVVGALSNWVDEKHGRPRDSAAEVVGIVIAESTDTNVGIVEALLSTDLKDRATLDEALVTLAESGMVSTTYLFGALATLSEESQPTFGDVLSGGELKVSQSAVIQALSLAISEDSKKHHESLYTDIMDLLVSDDKHTVDDRVALVEILTQLTPPRSS